jgi:hypothetical protein
LLPSEALYATQEGRLSLRVSKYGSRIAVRNRATLLHDVQGVCD